MLFEPTVMQIRGVDGALYVITDEQISGSAIYLDKGAKGLDAPSFDVKADEYPAIDGGFFRSARARVREIFLPLTITGTTRAEMLALKRRFINSLNPKRGLITLQSTEYAESGGLMVAETPRAISCYYVSGMEGGEGSGDGVHWARYGLVMRTPNPYFQHLSRVRASFITYDLLRPFITPGAVFLSLDGLTPGGGVALSTTPVPVEALDLDNPGDVETQPRWEIRGPLNSRISVALRDGEGHVLAELRMRQGVNVGGGQVLVIETTKGSQVVKRYPHNPAGVYDPLQGDSMWWALDITSAMWALQPGMNHVGLVVDKPAGMSPEQEAAWEAANQPEVSVSYLPTFMGI